MPEKLKNYQQKKANGYFRENQEGANFPSPAQQPPMPILQIQSLTDIALGGFNPNKYMTPQPPQFAQYGQNQSYIPFPQVHGTPQPMPFYGQPG